jgi:hypothetical protein
MDVAARRRESAFLGVSALLFAASAAVTIAWCSSMSSSNPSRTAFEREPPDVSAKFGPIDFRDHTRCSATERSTTARSKPTRVPVACASRPRTRRVAHALLEFAAKKPRRSAQPAGAKGRRPSPGQSGTNRTEGTNRLIRSPCSAVRSAAQARIQRAQLVAMNATVVLKLSATPSQRRCHVRDHTGHGNGIIERPILGPDLRPRVPFRGFGPPTRGADALAGSQRT